MALKTFPSVIFILVFGIVLNCGLPATASAQAEEPTETVETPKTEDSTAKEAVKEPEKESPQSEAPTKWPNFEKAFESGVASYRDKKYDEARLAFTAALEMQPDNVQALTNLALVQYQLGQKGWAVALLRRAQNLDPNFSTPKAGLEFVLPQLDVKEIPHEIQLWETVRSTVIVPFSLNLFLILTALTLFTSGWLLLQYFGKRKEAFRNEQAPPAFPFAAALIALVFISSLILTVLKFVDIGIPRATVVSEKVTVYSAPGDKSVALFDLYGGLEVIVGSSSEDWVQVTYPGALTGWVPKSSVFQTSGRKL